MNKAVLFLIIVFFCFSTCFCSELIHREVSLEDAQRMLYGAGVFDPKGLYKHALMKLKDNEHIIERLESDDVRLYKAILFIKAILSNDAKKFLSSKKKIIQNL